MDDYKTIKFEFDDDLAIVWLNRPEIHNAFNEDMILELLDCFMNINKMQDIRVDYIPDNIISLNSTTQKLEYR